jgi:hypothetical protein
MRHTIPPGADVPSVVELRDERSANGADAAKITASKLMRGRVGIDLGLGLRNWN